VTAEFVRQVESGNEVLLMRDSKPVARLVPANVETAALGSPLPIRSLKGHRVLTPVLSQAELADEMFARE
jgi:antitoxin (DNA-binding transcriptional repressor) of toxin-antitoxin stability system